MHGRTCLLVALLALLAAAPARAGTVTIAMDPLGADDHLNWTETMTITAVDHETGLDRVEVHTTEGDVELVWEQDVPAGEVLVWKIALSAVHPPLEGEAGIWATAWDHANTGISVSKWYTIDRRPPVVSFVGRPAGSTVLMEPGVLEAAVNVADADPAIQVTCTLDATVIACPPSSGTTRALNADVPPGAHTLTVTARDRAKNSGTAFLTVIGDDGPPVASIASGPADRARVRAKGLAGHERAEVSWAIAVTDIAGATAACRTYRREADPRYLPGFSPCGLLPEGRFGWTRMLGPGHWVFETRPTDKLKHDGGVVRAGFTVDPAPGVPFLQSHVTGAFGGTISHPTARIRVGRVPKRARVELRCEGSGCRQARAILPIRHGRADAAGALRRHGSTRGMRDLEIRVTAPGRVGRVTHWRLPDRFRTDLCLSPKSTTPKECWD